VVLDAPLLAVLEAGELDGRRTTQPVRGALALALVEGRPNGERALVAPAPVARRRRSPADDPVRLTRPDVATEPWLQTA
jgi:hypothetical protein